MTCSSCRQADGTYLSNPQCDSYISKTKVFTDMPSPFSSNVLTVIFLSTNSINQATILTPAFTFKVIQNKVNDVTSCFTGQAVPGTGSLFYFKVTNAKNCFLTECEVTVTFDPTVMDTQGLSLILLTHTVQWKLTAPNLTPPPPVLAT